MLLRPNKNNRINNLHHFHLNFCYLATLIMGCSTVASSTNFPDSSIRTAYNGTETVQYSTNELKCPWEDEAICSRLHSIHCGSKITYFNRETGRFMRLTFTPVPKRSCMEICLDNDFDYLYSFGNGVYLLQGDSLREFPGSQFCGVEGSKIGSVIFPMMNHLFCSSFGVILEDRLIIHSGKRLRIFAPPELAIAAWKNSAAELILGDHGTLVKISSNQNPAIQKSRIPRIEKINITPSQDQMNGRFLFFSNNFPEESRDRRITSYFIPSDTTKRGRPGCFFWGENSTQIFCPNANGLDTFPRTPDSAIKHSGILADPPLLRRLPKDSSPSTPKN